jgi:microcystin-dependent protein
MADKRRNLGIPSGVVFPFAGSTAPYGYLVCDGSAISRADYPSLFAALGTSHGSGDGSTTFNLPDYRGRFMRGVDGTAGRDPDTASRTAMAAGGNTGDAVGSVQGHSFQTHTHAQNAHTHTQNAHDHVFSGTVNSADAAAVPANYLQATASSTNASSFDVDYVASATATNQNTTATNQNAVGSGATSQASANETRPVNVSVNYIIKV